MINFFGILIIIIAQITQHDLQNKCFLKNVGNFVDSNIIKALTKWKNVIESAGGVKIGETKVNLEHTHCSYEECNIGNFYTDAVVHKLLQSSPYNNPNWTNVSIVLAAAGELYLTLPQGKITYGQIYNLCPYDAPLVAFDLEGLYLKAALEKSVSYIDVANNINSTEKFLQVAGLKIVYNLKNPVNQRVLQIKVRCDHCKLPVYEDLVLKKTYRIATTSYVARGGFGFSMFKQYGTNQKKYSTDLAALLEYVKETSPIYIGLEDRIKILNSE